MLKQPDCNPPCMAGRACAWHSLHHHHLTAAAEALECNHPCSQLTLSVGLQGMSEDVSISRFFDEPMLLEMARQEASLGQIL